LPESGGAAFSVSDLEEHGLFVARLDNLVGALRSTAESLGLKYSVDARLLSARNEVESLHSASLRRAEQAVAQVREQWAAASARFGALQHQYEAALASARTELADRIRRLQKSNAASLARASREAEALLRAEYRAKEQSLASVEKFNADKLRAIEEKVRGELKAASVAESRRGRAGELALQAQLERLEAQGMALLQAKETELAAVVEQKTELETKLAAHIAREQTWSRKQERSVAERARMVEESNSLRVELAQVRQDNQALLHRLTRAEEVQAAATREAASKQSQLADQVLSGREEMDNLRRELASARESAARDAAEAASTLAATKARHAAELAAIQDRIGAVLARKDEQLLAAKQHAQVQADKLRDMEKFMQEQLSGL
jgi:hypothetical protein